MNPKEESGPKILDQTNNNNKDSICQSSIMFLLHTIHFILCDFTMLNFRCQEFFFSAVEISTQKKSFEMERQTFFSLAIQNYDLVFVFQPIAKNVS